MKKEFYGVVELEKKEIYGGRGTELFTDGCFQDAEGSEEGMYVILSSFNTKKKNVSHTDILKFANRHVKITVETTD